MILGVSGKALSGKDTIADYLLAHYGWDRKIGFASNLKEACINIFGLSEYSVFTQEGKISSLPKEILVNKSILEDILEWMRRTHGVALETKDYTKLLGVSLRRPRDILQFVGTEVMRYYAPEYHTEATFRGLSSNENVIITDVRFPNEAEYIYRMCGNLIRVERPFELRSLYGYVPNSEHESETAMDSWCDWSYLLNNDTNNLGSLYEQIDEMVVTLESVG